MSVNLERGIFYCHGCKAKGDIYSWLMKWEKCTFREAKIKILGDARVSVLSEAEVEESHKYLLDIQTKQDFFIFVKIIDSIV